MVLHTSEDSLLFPHGCPENTGFANIKTRDANSKIANIVKNYKAGQLTNAVTKEKNPGNIYVQRHKAQSTERQTSQR